MSYEELGCDGVVRVLNWELVGRKVFFLYHGKITERTLNKITIEKDSYGLTVQTHISYMCDAHATKTVYSTKEACAEAWLREQGITVGLRDARD